ncbi:MAG TPA: hypothetical protein P5026_07555 [Kiritimatiellia bacterium]|nr:hypothetical protein [Kiritimatiellia bacterium]HRU70958.1 hypothetical protein [Kiritimatiellia bacterium]
MRTETRISEIGLPDPHFLASFARRMRAFDLMEVLGATGTPRGGVAAHLAREIADVSASGGRTWAVMEGAQALALFGVVPDSATARTARIWMLATDDAQARPVSFCRWSRRALCVMLEAYPEIEAFYNHTLTTIGRPRSWLEWLGAWFSVEGAYLSPWTGDLFQLFVIQREDAHV